MEASNHNVLVIGDKGLVTKNLQGRLLDLGWTSMVIDDACEKKAVELVKTCSTGLAIISNPSEEKIKKLERIVFLSHFEWIAIIDKSDLDCQKTRGMLRRSFYAYHTQPVNIDHIHCLLQHACAMHEMEHTDIKQVLNSHDGGKPLMVGQSPEMEKTVNTIIRVASVDAPVFISGESGTGKELAARSIHDLSKRAKGPFIAVNCGALPSELIQSELFGHEKGAFTGANQRKIGRIESAAGGTLFLDEIGDLPLDMQVNLLRFLEDHKIHRVGGNEEISVDVRILAATHIDLERAVEQGRFRDDLYHRLNVLQVSIPPLRERHEDIELLANHFFEHFKEERVSRVKGFSKESITRMQGYTWPGNIRELVNRVRRAVVMCEGRLITPEDLGLERRRSFRQPVTLEAARDAAESDVIKAALARNKNNIQRTANELGVSRVTLYRLIDKHDIIRHDEHDITSHPVISPSPLSYVST